MSRFYVSTENSRGNPVTAAGASRGQSAHIRGWDVGVEVDAHPGYDDPELDVFHVWATGGSNDPGARSLLGSVYLQDGTPVFRPNPIAPRPRSIEVEIVTTDPCEHCEYCGSEDLLAYSRDGSVLLCDTCRARYDEEKTREWYAADCPPVGTETEPDPDRWAVIESTPGYLPEDDDPPVFHVYSEAVAYLRERVEEYLDDPDGSYRVEEGWASRDNLSAVLIHDDTKTHDLGRVIEIVRDEV